MQTVNKVLAFIDGSDYAKSVCDHAAWIATRTDASIEVMHVLGRRDVADDNIDLSGTIGLGARTALLEELAELDTQKAKVLQKRGRALLEGARNRLTTAGVTQVDSKLRHGEIAETALSYHDQIELIVIGKRGEAADFDALHLGSNLERVARAVKTPILVASRAFNPIKRFVVAFDGGKSILKGIQHIADNPVFNDLHCHLLCVGTPTNDVASKVESSAELLRAKGYSVSTEMCSGQPEVEIARGIKDEDADLLIMGAFGHSRIRQLIIGSTTTEMIRSCFVPVMLFR